MQEISKDWNYNRKIWRLKGWNLNFTEANSLFGFENVSKFKLKRESWKLENWKWKIVHCGKELRKRSVQLQNWTHNKSRTIQIFASLSQKVEVEKQAKISKKIRQIVVCQKTVGKEQNKYENLSKQWGQFLKLAKTQKSFVKTTIVKKSWKNSEQSSTQWKYPTES